MEISASFENVLLKLIVASQRIALPTTGIRVLR